MTGILSGAVNDLLTVAGRAFDGVGDKGGESVDEAMTVVVTLCRAAQTSYCNAWTSDSQSPEQYADRVDEGGGVVAAEGVDLGLASGIPYELWARQRGVSDPQDSSTAPSTFKIKHYCQTDSSACPFPGLHCGLAFLK